ncbi:MAG: NUDIX domain-containing protein [Candidatus Eremiobacteraeota bacterium]|nr:NUDIX domain-containing protein [Candidatus Eremiobacteraeota bacterium]
MKYSIYIDSFIESGVDAAGMGILILDEKGKEIFQFCDFINKADPDRARYKALLRSFKEMRKRKINSFEVCTDNEFLIQQIQGIYRIRDPILKQLKNAISKKSHNVDFKIHKITLEENTRVNALAGRGLEKFKRQNSFDSIPIHLQIKKKIHTDKGKKITEDIQRSAGGVLYKKEGTKFRVCLIVKKGGKVWALPKGRVDEGERPEETAVREIGEETGHLGEIQGKIDEINYRFFWKESNTFYHKFVYFYLMRLIEENFRERDQEAEAVKWVTPEEAYSILTYINEKEVMKKARKILDNIVT